ncbi:MAG: Calvin cycle protein CP12 [Elainellaceae cyanobacterium]
MVQALQRPNQTMSTVQQDNRSFVDSTQLTLAVQIANALEAAREVSHAYGITSPESAVAWDIVEELFVAQSCQRETQSMTPFEEYCLQHPDAPESRIYEV